MEIETLQSKKDILSYLNGRGFKIRKSTLYLHIREGRLRPGADGAFKVKDVDRYAKHFLRRLDGSQTASQAIEAMQLRRIQAETEKMESQASHWKVKAQMAAGEVIEKSQFEAELVGRLIIFKTGLENFIRTETPELIRLCGGDVLKSQEVIRYMDDAAAEWLNDYARKPKWDIFLKEDPDDPDMLMASITRSAVRCESDDEDDDDELMENE